MARLLISSEIIAKELFPLTLVYGKEFVDVKITRDELIFGDRKTFEIIRCKGETDTYTGTVASYSLFQIMKVCDVIGPQSIVLQFYDDESTIRVDGIIL